MNRMFCASVLGLACALGGGIAHAQNAAADKAGSAAAKQDAPTAVLLLVPVQMAGDRLANGCWVRFYDGTNYAGSTLTLVGPVDMPKMDVPGAAWKDWDSAIVGPKATVITYDDENYRQRTARLGPGLHAPDLRDKKLGWFEEVHSARVTCSA